MLFLVITLTACGSNTDDLQERINTLEADNRELQSTVTSLQTELGRAQNELGRAQNELQNTQAALEEALNAQPPSSDDQNVELAITYGGRPNKDMSWPLNFGDLPVGLRVNPDDLGEGVEITWRSINEDIFTVVPSEDGMSATVTPLIVGSAELEVKVGDKVTRSWVRITG